MIKRFRPSMYLKTLYDLDLNVLKSLKIKHLFLDLDNTIVAHDQELATDKVRDFMKKLVDEGFSVHIFSNNNRSRVELFANDLGLAFTASARKPLTLKYKMILKEYAYNKSECLFAGDQIMTDVLGANRFGVKSLFVEPLVNRDIMFTKVNRVFENLVLKRLEKKNLLIKGQYYYE